MGSSKSKLSGSNLIRKKNSKRILNLDDLVIERLQYSHDVHRTLFDGNFSSPVIELLEKGAKVLEFRCGPGTWTCEMSSDFKNSKFHAIETVSCFPTQKPFNVEFIKSDKLDNRIPFPNDFFDFVYVRSAILWYTESQWQETIIPELIRILKPGGYLEFMEAEMELFGEGPNTPVMTKHIRKFRGMLESRKINPYMILEMPNLLSSTDQMVYIQKDMRKCPVGNWDPIIGEWGAELSVSLILTTLITTKLISKKEYDEVAKKMKFELNQENSYFRNHRVWAMKKN